MSGETLVSTAFLDKPPPGRQTTQAELWGVLPISRRPDDEWGQFTFMSADTENGTAEADEQTIHEGLLLNRLSDVCIKSVAVGGAHVVFLAEGGFALAYGRNCRGQLGIGDMSDRHEPEKVLFTGCMASPPPTLEPHEELSPDGSGARRLSLGVSDNESEEPTEAADWSIAAVACGSDHSLLLARHPTVGSRVFACGAYEALGLEGAIEDQPIALGIRQLADVAAIAARKDACCCAAPAQVQAGDEGATPSAGSHLLYFWGEVPCCLAPCYHPEPTPLYRVPTRIKALGMGAFFGLALDECGTVYAWGDGTYGELGGAEAVSTDAFGSQSCLLEQVELPVPGCVVLPADTHDRDAGIDSQPSAANLSPPPTSSMDAAAIWLSMASDDVRGIQSEEPPPTLPWLPPAMSGVSRESSRECRPPVVVDVACGERHSLLLDDRGRVFAFGENLAGQCGVPEVVGAGHITGNTVPRPRLVPMEGPRRCCSGGRHGPPRPYELGARVFAGNRHSAMVTRDHRLYIWGHPSNRKLGHAGFNPDGTEAGDRPSKKRPPGVAVRSALRDAVRRPRFVYSLLHRRVRALGLGEECTVIVTGDGASGAVPGENDSHEEYPQTDGSFVLPVSPGAMRRAASL